MTYKLFLVDDKEADSLVKTLDDLGNGDFDVQGIEPPANLGDLELGVVEVDVLLVDYELDTLQSDGTIANYRGTTFAARVREIYPELPIILVTRSDLEAWRTGKRTVEAVGAFDGVLYKEEHLRKDRKFARDFLISLAEGYRTLRMTSPRTLANLLKLLRTDVAGERYSRAATPPPPYWTAFEASIWIRTVLLNFPGVLYDSVHAATHLGISMESFEAPQVQEILQGARYQGIFHQEAILWWRHRLFDIVNDMSVGTGWSPASRDAFRELANQRLGPTLEPARDVEDETHKADTVCYVLNEPARIATSLPYHPDRRPRIMDEARVSFKAIKENDVVNEDYLDSSSRAIFERILELYREN